MFDIDQAKILELVYRKLVVSSSFSWAGVLRLGLTSLDRPLEGRKVAARPVCLFSLALASLIA